MTPNTKEAASHSPAILFIDEIDGIGIRGNGRKAYSDYWNAIVNRALELFDGVTKTTGVILVGATNRPSHIDPALLRSGRLEKHIAIPAPGIDALCGILAHQLGADLDNVILSAPQVPVERDAQIVTDVTGASAAGDER
jgi:ATP-dependent Zn protease